MQALYLKNSQLHYTADYPQPIPRSGEALIRLHVAGICATDIWMMRGYKAGFEGVLGHEFVGTVEAVADVADRSWLGCRVVGGINLLPESLRGRSRQEAEGLAKHHPERTTLGIWKRDGAFADYVTLPVQNLHLVPDQLSDEQAVFTEPLAAAFEIREQVYIRPNMRVAVIGPGRLGMLCGAVLALSGANVIMLGRREASLLLAQSWGLETGLVADATTNAFDLVVEATGNDSGFAHALRLVRPQGMMVLKSTFQGETPFDLTRLVVDEITLIGSRCGPFPPALHLLAQGKVDVEAMIDGRYPLREGHEALVHAGRAGVRKILLYP